MVRYIETVLVPYTDKVKEELDLPIRQQSIAIFDVFRAHRCQEVLDALSKARIQHVFVPAGCTGELQPMDLSVNGELKAAMKNEFMNWYADMVAEDLKDSSTINKVDLRLSVLKPLHAKWLSKVFHDFEVKERHYLARDTGSSAIHQDRGINIEPHVFELYIDLMCQFKPNEVLNYIKMNEGYRLEQTLQICRKYKLSEATAFLLEKAGDIQGAFGIILQKLQAKLKLFVDVMQGGNTDKDLNVLFLEIDTLAIVIIQLCQRNSGKMDEASREALWFPLLETVMTPQRKLKDIDNKDVLDDFNKLTHHILNSMMGYIALPAILQKIMQDPAYNTGKFGEVRELILGMLETYNYEQTLMKTCKNLLNHDIHVHLKSLTSAAVRGYIPRGDNCNLCNKLFINQNETDSVVVFRCGHSYHLPCLRSVGSVHVMDGEEMWACYLCSHSKRGRIQSTRFHRSLSNPNQAALQQTKEKSKEMTLDSQHIQAIDAVRKAMKTPSRMAILTELSRSDTRSVRGSSGIFHQENFQLRLAPPIAPTNS
ncbi:vacuolar protein sorting-associated protein 8 [Mytilus galloprovincialis]|uniref:Vacuolar protein sorting-associated protein 8 n=1 Tax=Mytilus galloprovincialis TaxID=29158 RepID=A0A8B6FCH6_MYTGA|nr:vacuolar protein sorting-associated protein 8 [Mytilus galloprovincialis]